MSVSSKVNRNVDSKIGAIISDIMRIERTEDVHFLFDDADFSISTIKHLIKEGENDAENVLTGKDCLSYSCVWSSNRNFNSSIKTLTFAGKAYLLTSLDILHGR